MPRKHERTLSSDDSAPLNAKRQKPNNARLERKRELDRVAQRTIREKTRNHVAQLEALVQALQAGNDSDGRIGKLVAQLDEQTREINRLRNALDSIIKITNATCNPMARVDSATNISQEQEEPGERCSSTPTHKERHKSVHGQPAATLDALNTTPNSENHSQTSPVRCQEDPQTDSTTQESSAMPFLTSPHPQSVSKNVQEVPSADSLLTFEPDKQNAQSVSQIASTITGNRKLEGRLWYLAGTLLNHILKFPEQRLYSAAFDEDIAIRAVIGGWSAVMERYPLDRGWQWLKELDETIYFHWDIASRLMHLRNCRLQFLHQMFPSADWDQILPPFFTARPSQQHLHHDPLIEHFPWPSFRERLLFCPRKYVTNKFMEKLQQCGNFTWGYGPHELYERDTHTGLYSYSGTFLRQLMDIRCYTVKPAFFDQFPELRGDIPVNNPSPFNIFPTYVPADSMRCILDTESVQEEGLGRGFRRLCRSSEDTKWPTSCYMTSQPSFESEVMHWLPCIASRVRNLQDAVGFPHFTT